MSTTRQPGYYRIKNTNGFWYYAEWTGSYFQLLETSFIADQKYLAEVDENRIPYPHELSFPLQTPQGVFTSLARYLQYWANIPNWVGYNVPMFVMLHFPPDQETVDDGSVVSLYRSPQHATFWNDWGRLRSIIPSFIR